MTKDDETMIKRFKVLQLDAIVFYLKRHYKFVGLTAVLALGILIGSLCAGNIIKNQTFDLSQYFQNYLNERTTQSYLSVVLHATVSSIPYLLIAYCAGLFVLGTPISACVPFLYGLGIGMTCGYLYAMYGLKGTAFSLLTIVPPAFFTAILLIIACRDAVDFSKSLASCYMRNQPAVLPTERFKRYHLRYGMYLLLLIGIGLIDGLLSEIFIGVFGF